MITSGGIKIYFLKQCKIRFIRSNEFTGSLYGVLHTFFAFCPGGSAAVHEETEVRCVSTETKVVGQCGVGFPGSQCLSLIHILSQKWFIAFLGVMDYFNFSFSAFKSSRLSPCSPAVLSTQRFKESMAKEISSSFLLI